MPTSSLHVCFVLRHHTAKEGITSEDIEQFYTHQLNCIVQRFAVI